MSPLSAPYRRALLVAAIMPLSGSPQSAERYTLAGNAVTVMNVAGVVTIERGTGSAVTVEVRRGGADAQRLRIVERTVSGRATLCVEYPDERIVYRPDDARDRSSNSSSGYSCDGNGSRSRFSNRRVEVRSRGGGVEAWADLRIQVPDGRDVRIEHLVGRVAITGVNASLDVDVASASVESRQTRGDLTFDAGSGGISVREHRGALSVDVGSGAILIEDVESSSVNLDTGSGSVAGVNVRTDDLIIGTGSGGVELSRVSSRRAKVGTGSGRVRVALTSAVDDLQIGTGSGSVTVALGADLNARLNITTGSGGIQTDFPVSVRRTSRNTLDATVGDGSGRVRITTGSGGVRLTRVN